MQIRDLSISAKLTLATTSAVILMFLLVSSGILITLEQVQQQEEALLVKTFDRGGKAETLLQEKTAQSIEITGALFAELAADALGSDQGLSETARDRLAELASAAARDPEIAYLAIRDPQGENLLTAGDTAPRADTFREFPVPLNGDRAYVVEVGLSAFFTPAVTESFRELGEELKAQRERQNQAATAMIVGLVLLALVLTGLAIQIFIAALTKRFINRPASRIRQALESMERDRDYSGRVVMEADDELGSTVTAFNRGLDFLEEQNSQLNDSVIDLLESAGRISQLRDLTIKAPVREDITGPLGDALNRLTRETGKVLERVRVIAEQVANASEQVQHQGQRVVDVADREQEIIESTSSELTRAIEAIDGIARLAQQCNDAAQTATGTTDEALESVSRAVDGMGNIRETIQETGKRIKRLGERSQEISGIVDIINSFAERTHVLAINASMQAVNSGEAGKGFAVVAQEVQRLADSSRSATSQIANLIGNIQVETSDTIQTVNQATEAVGEQSRTVESAGEQMRLTQQTNASLAEAVQQIYDRSQAQTAANSRLLEQIDTMRSGTAETTDQLAEQTEQTNRLAKLSNDLIEAIRLFKLQQTQEVLEQTTEPDQQAG